MNKNNQETFIPNFNTALQNRFVHNPVKVEDKPFSTWLTYVFQLENNEWRIIHDHNTAPDPQAFAKSAGMNNE